MKLNAWEQARFNELTEHSRSILAELNEIHSQLEKVSADNVLERHSLESRYMSVSMELTPVLVELHQLQKTQDAPGEEHFQTKRRSNGHLYVNDKRVWTYEELTAEAERHSGDDGSAEMKVGAFGLWNLLTWNSGCQTTEDYERICGLIVNTSDNKVVSDFLQAIIRKSPEQKKGVSP
jgi:DNA-binding HxlR family transcriptional regulator